MTGQQVAVRRGSKTRVSIDVPPPAKSILKFKDFTHDIIGYYLTQPVNTDIGAVLRAQSPVFDFAGQRKEEIIAFGEAVELANILI